MIGDPIDKKLKECIRYHCQAGIRERSRYGVAIGCGNTDLVIEIISKSLALMGDEKRDADTLAKMVGVATGLCTNVGFSWATVSRIIETGGKARLLRYTLDALITPYPDVTDRLGYGPESSLLDVKSGVRNLAQAILWAEAFTFLREFLDI